MERLNIETGWLNKAETEICEHFPQEDFAFEPFDCGLQLGVCVKIGGLRRAIRLESGDDWVKRAADLIDETSKMSVP